MSVFDHSTAQNTRRYPDLRCCRLEPEIQGVREALRKRVAELESSHGEAMAGLKKTLSGAENGLVRCKERRAKMLQVFRRSAHIYRRFQLLLCCRGLSYCSLAFFHFRSTPGECDLPLI